MTASLAPPATTPARRHRIRLAKALAAITLAAGVVNVAVLPSDSAEAAPVYWNAAAGADRISVIGDSVMAAIRWYGTWQPLRSYSYVVDVESCRRTTTTSCRGREGYQPDTTLNAMRRLRGQLGSVLVIGTGYDDPGATFGSAVDAVMAEAASQGIPVVVWATMRTADVTYVGPTYSSNASTFRDNNRILLAKAAQYGGRLQVADWASYSASRRDWVERDGIHLTRSGATAMAQFIADQAAAVLPGTPSAPTLAAQAVGSTEVLLSWTAPAWPGKSPIVDYGYLISPDGGATWISDWAGPASGRSWVVGGLTHGGHYQFRLIARNAAGWGAFSNATSAKTMLMTPSAPTLTATAVGPNEVELTWTAPTFTGGAPIIDYGYVISPDGGATWISDWAGPASGRSWVVGGLTHGGHYQFRLIARNAAGWGAFSNATSAKTMLMTPSAPTLTATAVGPNEVELTWTAPTFTGGAPIIDYGYVISPDGGATWISGWAGPASGRSWVVGGLTHGGHYQFRLIARNAAGWGTLSNATSAKTMLMTPSAPTLTATAVGPTEVELTWTAPTFTGGAPIIDYGYVISPDGGATWISGWAGPASGRSWVVGGLTQGGHYQFRLLARNAAGWGTFSNATSAMAGGSFDMILAATDDTLESDVSTSEPATSQPASADSTTAVSTEVSEASALDSSVGDFVWVDANLDGVQNEGEQGLGNVVVRLIDDSGAVVDEDVSDSQGRYELASPSSDSSSLEVVVPARYRLTIVDVGLDEAIDSDVDPRDVLIGPAETTVRVDLDKAAVDRLDADLDIGLVVISDESTTSTTTTTTSSIPTTTTTIGTTTTQASTTILSVPLTEARTTVVPQPTDAPPPTQPTTTESVTTSPAPGQ